MLELAPLEINNPPFQYFVSTKTFNKKQYSSILDWFEKGAPWELVETDFYEQYEFDLSSVEIPNHLSFLNERDFLNNLVKRMENLFQVSLTAQVDLTAHKLLNGQTIRIHNDYIEGNETHRVIIQLNRRWRDENGGFLMFFNSADPNDVHRVFRPLNNMSVGFEISPNSYHAVSTIYGGERYTLVYSFYESHINH